MLLSMSTVIGVNAQETDAYAGATDAEIVFDGLGIIELKDYTPSKRITRGEFATLIASILLYGQENGEKKPPMGDPLGLPHFAAHTKIQAAAASLRALVCVVGGV